MYKEQGWPMVQLSELVVTEILRNNEQRKLTKCQDWSVRQNSDLLGQVVVEVGGIFGLVEMVVVEHIVAVVPDNENKNKKRKT